jgi:hypothetical protein
MEGVRAASRKHIESTCQRVFKGPCADGSGTRELEGGRTGLRGRRLAAKTHNLDMELIYLQCPLSLGAVRRTFPAFPPYGLKSPRARLYLWAILGADPATFVPNSIQ